MREMQTHCCGQYECNNQNSFHILWMLAAVHNGRCARRAQPFLHKVLTKAFKSGVDMWPGDEDNGSMSAFFLLSAAGIYQLLPSSGKWLVTGSPLFNHLQLRLGANSDVLSIVKRNAAAGNCVASRVWNGKILTEATLSYQELVQGGTLEFHMENCTQIGDSGA